MSTWIHFCIKNPAKSRLGGLLGRLVGVLAASCILGSPKRHLGDYCMLLNGLGRFQNALEPFQEAPDRESLILHWFWEVWVGGPQGRANPGGGLPDPLNQDFSRQTQNQDQDQDQACLELPLHACAQARWRILDVILQLISDGFCFQKPMPEL